MTRCPRPPDMGGYRFSPPHAPTRRVFMNCLPSAAQAAGSLWARLPSLSRHGLQSRKHNRIGTEAPRSERFRKTPRKQNPCLRRVEICGLCPQTMKPRNLFGFGASFTLAAIYSRGTCRPTTIDVLMFHFRVRNGTGWGHQAMTTRFQIHFLARSSLLLIRNS